MDTIFALASAQGKSGVAVVRVSGPGAFGAGERLAGTLPAARTAALRVVRDVDGNVLDRALVLCFDKDASFTGEQVVEFHLHGSRAVVAAVLRELATIDGLRHAEAGEFTRRALENGRLDLAEVEGLADLIEAETEMQRRQALRGFSGELRCLTEEWRADLIRAAALLEATIDFADEDVPEDVAPEVVTLLQRVRYPGWRHRLVAQRRRNVCATGSRLRSSGRPNVGKSTLLNRLAGREAAITSEHAGTTRDVIEVRMDIAGLPVTLLDTAGLRESEDAVENIGIERARERAAAADLRVFLVDDGAGDEHLAPVVKENDIVLRAKADLQADKTGAISGVTGEGIEALIGEISLQLGDRARGAGLATRERHRAAMDDAVVCIDGAMDHISVGRRQTDLAAEEVRGAVRRLESLIGRVDVENVLDEIFSSFCLGK